MHIHGPCQAKWVKINKYVNIELIKAFSTILPLPFQGFDYFFHLFHILLERPGAPVGYRNGRIRFIVFERFMDIDIIRLMQFAKLNGQVARRKIQIFQDFIEADFFFFIAGEVCKYQQPGALVNDFIQSGHGLFLPVGPSRKVTQRRENKQAAADGDRKGNRNRNLVKNDKHNTGNQKPVSDD